MSGNISTQDLFSVSSDDIKPAWTLLLIEDNPANASLVEDLLARRDDIKLSIAVSGYQGLEMAHSLNPDVILTDIRLYDLNGFDVLKALKLDPTTANTPVIAVSSNARLNDIEQGLEAGFFRYLTKPFKIVELMSAIDSALQNIGLMRQTKSG